MRASAMLLVAGVLAGCSENTPRPESRRAIGDPAGGRQIITEVGCGSCHTIPGIRGADGLVGPPLLWWARRTFIAGQLPNTPDNLMRWLQNPPGVEPHTAMPALGLDERQARDVAAYLYTLR